MEGIEDALSHAYKKKMQTPIATGMASNLESPFSATSLQDITNNLLSAQYSYTGVDPLTGATGPGVAAHIKARNQMADPARQEVINAAITAIQTAHDTFANQVQPLLAPPDAD